MDPTAASAMTEKVGPFKAGDDLGGGLVAAPHPDHITDKVLNAVSDLQQYRIAFLAMYRDMIAAAKEQVGDE